MRKWYPLILIVGAFAFSTIVFGRLPATIPIHWDIRGHANGYSGRMFGAYLAPVFALAMWGLLRGLPLIDPRRTNYAKFQGTYDLVVNAVITLIAALDVVVLGKALGWPIPVARLASVSVGAMLLLLGNVLPRARSNWWFGIRTPWTLSSESVWTKTHRVGGYLMSAAGVIVLGATLLPAVWSTGVIIGAVTAASLGSVIYSYFAWREEQP
ncbi:MAG TPA: SdpI family protein [Gemmatimonadaceae bacterium]